MHLRVTRREMVQRALRFGRRLPQLIRDGHYRDAIIARTFTRALAQLYPDLRYLGIDDEGGVTFIHLTDSVITPYILASGGFQKVDFLRVRELAQRYAPRPTNGVFVDIGANVGTSTLYAMRSGTFARALCMEPSPDNLEALRLNLTANDFEDRVTVVPAACGAGLGTAQLWLSEKTQGDHRVGSVGASPPSTHAPSIKVELTTLDAALSHAEIDPSEVALVWIDTQGHEPDVLAGATATIAGGAPFSIEFWPGQYAKAGKLEQIVHIVSRSFASFIDVSDPQMTVRPMSDLSALSAQLLSTSSHTDLLLIPPLKASALA